MTRVIFALVLSLFVSHSINTHAQNPTPPIIEALEPKTASVNAFIELKGYRLYSEEPSKTKVVFFQQGSEIPAPPPWGSTVGNHFASAPQTLKVIVPDGVVEGLAQIIIEVNGVRSNPVSLSISEWTPPEIKRVTPTTVAPGTIIEIECTGLHLDDELEITDADGHPVRFHGGGSSAGTAFGVPEDASEGVWTVRIGNRKYGKGQFTEAFTINISNEALSLELTEDYLQPVAPGQWLDLQSTNSGPLKHSELTEVLFKQAGRTIVVATEKSFRPHVEVPAVLTPGEVQMQARTWRNGQPSEWSQPVSLKLLEKPIAPSIASIRLDKGQWVQLSPGPKRASIFKASRGDRIVLHGLLPVADASKLKVTLVRPGDAIELSVSEFDYQHDWFGEVEVRLPENLEPGEWRMVVSSESHGTSEELPIVILVG